MLGWANQFLSEPWPALTLVVSVVVALAACRPLAKLLGWHRWYVLGALLGLGAIVTLTIPPGPGGAPGGPDLGLMDDCAGALFDPTTLWHGLTATTKRGERVGNILMFVPFTFFATLASRRPLLVAAAGILLPIPIELTQAFTNGGRDCVGYDWVNNASGAVLGTLAAAWILHRSRPSRAGTESETVSGRGSG
jgi:hypothetical protein